MPRLLRPLQFAAYLYRQPYGKETIADRARNLVPNDRRVTALPDAHRARDCGSPRATRDDRVARHHRQDLREHGEVGQPA